MIPAAGTVIRALRQPLVHLVLVGALPAVLVVWLLVAIWRPNRSAGEQDGDSGAAAGRGAEM